MPSTDIKIRRFTRETITVADVRLSVLKLVEEEGRQVYGDPLEAVARILEEEPRNQDLDYVVVEVQDQNSKRIIGEGFKRRGGILLYPKPVQLKRVGIVRAQTLKPTGETGYYRFREEEIEWYNIEDEKVYVYDLAVEAPQDIVFLVVETSDGRSIARIQRSSPHQQSYRPQPQQDQSSENNATS
ncbi:MAG: hypothetical protein LM584_04605 [Desulfurococcaceae archaeon]|jgi:hypothetical protein|nr:hypothetical protein [Desulfurococcaceae archaeon]